MRIQIKNNQIIGYGEIYGDDTFEVENLPENPFDYDYVGGEFIRTRFSDFKSNFKVKMNSDKFIAMTSEVPTILPDLTNNIAEFGITEIYLDEIGEDLRTLMSYFDENVLINKQ